MNFRMRVTATPARRTGNRISVGIMFAVLAAGISGCGLVGEFGRLNTTLEHTTQHPDSLSMKLGAGLSKGIIDSLTSAESQRKIKETVNALVSELLETAENKSPDVIDALLGEKFQTRLKEIWAITDSQLIAIKDRLIGSETRKQLVALRNAVLDEGLMLRVAALRDTLTGTPLTRNMAALRDTLLGDQANRAISAIIDSAIVTLARRYESDLQPKLREELNFFKKNAEGLLLTIALLTIGIIAFVWHQKRKYSKLVTLLTTRINRMKDEKAYLDLTREIRDKAQSEGMEDFLRKELARQDLLGTEAWLRSQKKGSTGTET